MKNLSCLLVLLISVTHAFSQENIVKPEKYTAHNKGKFFISWGGNRDLYSTSDITFSGTDYKFTLDNAQAHDVGKGWHIDYINPAKMTIPQTNFRMGYFINDHYSIAIGWDHMKYVMTQNQIADMTGYINGHPPYDGTYDHQPTEMTEDFLTFEHTDGLNYVNSEFSRHDDISRLFKINNTDKIQINLTEGIGGGILYPKTNTKLMGNERHDSYHISGYGLSVKAGLNITLFKYFYIQPELKGGYINMQDVRTTKFSSDTASQHFYFLEKIISFGAVFKL